MMVLKPFSNSIKFCMILSYLQSESSHWTLFSRSDWFGSEMKMTTRAKRAFMKKIHRTSPTIFYAITVSCTQYTYFITNTSATHRIAYSFDFIMVNIPSREWVLSTIKYQNSLISRGVIAVVEELFQMYTLSLTSFCSFTNASIGD